MKAIKALISISILSVFSACGVQELKLGYFQVEPYAKPFDRKVRVPLNIVLMEEVKDSVVVQGEGIRKMTVTEFRRSAAASLINTLGKNFENITILVTKPDTGLNLVIYRIRPFWKFNGRSSSSHGTGGYTYSTSRSFISAAFQFESSLFFNDEKLQNADLTIYSDDQMSTRSHAYPVFKRGLIKMCETMNREIFTDEVTKRINDH